MRSIKIEIDIINEKIKEILKAKEALKSKFAIDDKSLRESSGFF
jgi:hypothetical protein